MPIPFLAPDDETTPFPDVAGALGEPNGLLMAGGNLSPRRLLDAYRAGIFPWYEAGEPILWWSPDPRCVLWPESLRITRSLGKTIRSGRYSLSEDRAYGEVMRACGAPRAGSSGTWITEEMIEAYCTLARAGYARSVEVWMGERLVGGLYGIALGRVFVGESMFSHERDASKVALAHLAGSGRYRLIDCQLETPHLVSMGATSIARARYVRLLAELGEADEPRADVDERRDPARDGTGDGCVSVATDTPAGSNIPTASDDATRLAEPALTPAAAGGARRMSR